MINATPRPLYTRERPGTPGTRGWVGPKAGLDGRGKSRHHWDLTYLRDKLTIIRWQLYRVCWWQYSLKLAAFYGTRARKTRYWFLSNGICMDGVHFLTHTVSCMYTNIIRSWALSFCKWSRRFSISIRFVSCFYLIGVSHALPISYSLIYVSKRLLPCLENGRFSEL